MNRADLEIQPTELRDRLAVEPAPILLDVRRDDEVAIWAFPGAIHIPLHEIAARLDELDSQAETVVYCHHGVRSLSAAAYLRAAGFRHVKSLAGGVDRWAVSVDGSVPRY